ncbi:MAG: hypothetical protein BA866_11040 [Desulfobulbaceae bacterium S5133MH15]|nr:MAG: hypothetical protein BA866_11040 [Desulfobulbaceae bacterium S5133MH15]
MRFNIGSEQVEIEYQVPVLVLICLGWSLYYYLSTVSKPYGGAESVLFIKPLLIALALSAPFVIAGAVKINPQEITQKTEKDSGILNPKRIVFVISIFVYAASLPFLGYLIPSIAYLLIICFYMGLRNIYVYIGVLAGYAMLLWVGFKNLMGVPIPVLPGF